MTEKQREKLRFLAGRLEGLSWGVESNAVAEALVSTVEDIDKLLKDDAPDEDDVPLISMEGYK